MRHSHITHPRAAAWRNPVGPFGLLTLLVLLCSFIPAGAAQLPALPQVDEAGKSVFVHQPDPRFGKDPFFPKSERFKPRIVLAVGSAPDTSVYTQVFNSVALKGISGLPGKRLALLNNRTLETGEYIVLQINNQPVKVRCVEIKDRSVVIGIEGTTETKEIHLRPGM